VGHRTGGLSCRASSAKPTRLAALALVAVTAAAAAVSAREAQHDSSLPPPAGGWRSALAVAVRGSMRADACGVPFGGPVAGLRSADLPCGVKVYLRLGDRIVLSEIVDHAPPTRAAAFDVSPALARLLGLRGRRRLEWSFAGQ
jgi:hypothetical protein